MMHASCGETYYYPSLTGELVLFTNGMTPVSAGTCHCVDPKLKPKTWRSPYGPYVFWVSNFRNFPYFLGHQFKVCLFGFWYQQFVDVHPKKWYHDPPWLMRV